MFNASRWRSDRGFSVVELMIVVIVASILVAATGMITWRAVVGESHDRRVEQTLREYVNYAQDLARMGTVNASGQLTDAVLEDAADEMAAYADHDWAWTDSFSDRAGLISSEAGVGRQTLGAAMFDEAAGCGLAQLDADGRIHVMVDDTLAALDCSGTQALTTTFPN